MTTTRTKQHSNARHSLANYLVFVGFATHTHTHTYYQATVQRLAGAIRRAIPAGCMVVSAATNPEEKSRAFTRFQFPHSKDGDAEASILVMESSTNYDGVNLFAGERCKRHASA